MSDQQQPKYTKVSKPLMPNQTDFHVDIIIPFKDQYEHLTKLIESILRFVRYPRYNIHLADDNSKNKTFLSSFEKVQGFHTHRFDEDMGFGKIINNVVAKTKSNIVCVMHSDTEVVEPAFLWNITKAMLELKNERVAQVSSVCENPMSKECNFLKKTKSEDIPPIIIDDSYLPFFCTVFSKLVFQKLGGLPEHPYCWYEDMIFAQKLKKWGYKQAYAPNSFIKHAGGKTIKSLVNENPKILEKIKNNARLYKEQNLILNS